MTPKKERVISRRVKVRERSFNYDMLKVYTLHVGGQLVRWICGRLLRVIAWPISTCLDVTSFPEEVKTHVYDQTPVQSAPLYAMRVSTAIFLGISSHSGCGDGPSLKVIVGAKHRHQSVRAWWSHTVGDFRQEFDQLLYILYHLCPNCTQIGQRGVLPVARVMCDGKL